MKIRPEDFSLLRGSLLFFMIAVILSVAGWVGSWQYQKIVDEEKSAAERSLSAARAQLANARAQRQYFAENQSTYAELANKGLFSEEKRLDWIETIQRLRDRHRIFNIDYTLSAQEPMAPGAANVAAYATKVDLQFGLLHEQDLLDFFADFRNEVPGIFVLNSCALKREGQKVAMATESNLSADCSLQWISVKEKLS